MMRFETIDEPVEVITYFEGGKIRPLRFRWRGRPYHIAQVHGIWSAQKGEDREYHFHVATKESGSFELIYRNARCIWKLARITIDE